VGSDPALGSCSSRKESPKLQPASSGIAIPVLTGLLSSINASLTVFTEEESVTMRPQTVPYDLQELHCDIGGQTKANLLFHYRSEVFYKGLFKDFTFCFL